MNKAQTEVACILFWVVLFMAVIVLLIGYFNVTTTTAIHGHCIVQTTVNGWNTVLHRVRLCTK